MVYKIVLTGGSCSLKATIIQKISQKFTDNSYRVIIVPSAYNILINTGISDTTSFDFQKSVIDLQRNLERIAYDSITDEEETIILCDSGILDSKAYVSEKEFYDLLNYFNLDQLDVSVSYDMIVHFRNIAVDNEESHSFDESLEETSEETKELNQKVLESWAGHSKLRIINNMGALEDKIDNVYDDIYKLVTNSHNTRDKVKRL